MFVLPPKPEAPAVLELPKPVPNDPFWPWPPKPLPLPVCPADPNALAEFVIEEPNPDVVAPNPPDVCFDIAF